MNTISEHKLANGGVRQPLDGLGRGPRRALLTLWCLVLLFTVVGTMLPGGTLDMIERSLGSDEPVEHFLAYLLLALLPALWSDTLRTAMGFLAAVLLLGVFLEWLQQLAPDRAFELSDIAMNFAGALAGLLLGSAINAALRLRRRTLRY